MVDMNALYHSLLVADEASDAAALTAVAWQMYAQLATATADLSALRARFRVYAAAPHAVGRLGPACDQPKLAPAPRLPKPGRPASVSLGTVEPPGPWAGLSGNEPCQGNGCLPAAGLTARLPVARPGPYLPCTDDPDLFFAESPDEVEAAKTLCRQCPARAACLAGALQRREPWGVWGGELVLRGAIVPRKRPRGRPRNTDLAA